MKVVISPRCRAVPMITSIWTAVQPVCPQNIAALAQRLSARHFSVGADGIICICAPVTPGADGRMRIFNADGSEAQMCGNGVRCVAEWLYTHGVAKSLS